MTTSPTENAAHSVAKPLTLSWRWHGVLVAVALCAAFTGAGRSRATSEDRSKHQLQIEKMTDEARQELQAQFALWQKMPEAERERYRVFHDELKANAELRKAFDSYSNWLASVSRPERDELRAAKNATERIVKMQAIVERQTNMGQRSTETAYPKFGDPNVLTREDFKAAMQAAEEVLIAEDPNAARILENMRGKDELNRHRNVLHFVLQSLASEKMPEMNTATNAMDAATAAIADLKTQQRLSKINLIEHRRIRTYYLLVRTLAAAITERRPDLNTERGQRVLDEAFFGLDPNIQEDLTRAPPDEFWGMVMRRYSKSKDIADIPPGWQMIILADPEKLPQRFQNIRKGHRPDRFRPGNFNKDAERQKRQ